MNRTSASPRARVSGIVRLSMLQSALQTGLAGAISLMVVFPLVWIISTSLKSRAEVSRDPLGLPKTWLWSNYPEAWDVGRFGTYFLNSILVVVPVVLGVLLLSLLAAYAFAMFTFRGKNVLFVLFLAGLAIPIGVLVVPLFYQMLALNLVNTLWALILPEIAVSLPFGILLLRSFIGGLPRAIMDAGRIDGCNALQLLWCIVAPLSRPALLSLLIFNFMWSWNQFLLPVVLVQTESARTLPLGLSFFQGRYSSDLPLLMAGATISFIPIVIIYVIFQRQFIKGITAGALK
ncbi:MAG: carbohydrate ABC transporter permease [Trueperaceae bacterium]